MEYKSLNYVASRKAEQKSKKVRVKSGIVYNKKNIFKQNIYQNQMKNQSQGELQTPNEGQDAAQNIHNESKMNNMHNNNVKSANQLNTIMEREHVNMIKNQDHQNDSEIFAVPRPISENKSSSVFNIVAADKVVMISDNEIKEQDDFNSSVERNNSLDLKQMHSKFKTINQDNSDNKFQLETQISHELYRCFKNFIRTNFDKYVALKVDETQKVYNTAVVKHSTNKARPFTSNLSSKNSNSILNQRRKLIKHL